MWLWVWACNVALISDTIELNTMVYLLKCYNCCNIMCIKEIGHVIFLA